MRRTNREELAYTIARLVIDYDLGPSRDEVEWLREFCMDYYTYNDRMELYLDSINDDDLFNRMVMAIQIRDRRL